ncbi:hypothetical protein [Massilia genomosp. 1]|uniref:DUF4384 domain-containing protein n=1 Tax=Massilia genomosp. 1 TaxID=2609280 RepID=A0ABX0MH24_9BURK|nr:hypothetical protein [Massilia genomosp. 1]NHZ62099.1 hypothetical protein [Massilia genomosp. 1]
MNKLLFAFAAACVFTGSTAAQMKAPPKEALMHRQNNQTVVLWPQTSVTLAPDTVLFFERVDDSRCPPDVFCITAGKIVYHFSLTFPTGQDTLIVTTGQEPFDLEPAKPTYISVQRPDLVITLATIPPPPQPSNTPPPPPSPVRLTVSQAPSESR